MASHVGQSESYIYRLKDKYANTPGDPKSGAKADPKLLIVHSIMASNLTGFGPTTAIEHLETIQQIQDPAPLERDVFIRPSG